MIGAHLVTLIPDPDAQNWGPALASNPFFNVDLAGWSKAVMADGSPMVWAAPGMAVLPTNQTTSGVGVFRAETSPINRDASTQYRVRARVSVGLPCWIIPGLYYGKTPHAAWIGDFWDPVNARNQSTWVSVPAGGTYTVEGVFNTAEIPPEFAFLGPYVQIYASNPYDPRMAMKVDSLELNGQGAEQIDITCLLDQVSIHHGRDDSGSQPEASTATLDLSLDTGMAALPDGLDVGSIIRVETRTAVTNSIRFIGRITDVALGWEDRGEDTPNAVSAQVQAASAISELGRRIVGDTPFPQELDGARVARILSLAGVTLDPTFSDPGKVQILPRDVDAQDALGLAQGVAVSASGVVWQTRSGEVRYADSEHRRGVVPALTLDACDILVTPTWQRNTEGLINRVAIGYGGEAGGGEQAQWIDSRPDSVAAYGRYEFSQQTELAALADAQALASLYLTRNVAPVWILQALPVDMAGLDPERTSAILGLDMHALVQVVGLPIAGGTPSATTLWVEGWTETLAYGVHDLLLSVSGYCRTSPPPRWDDMDPDATWDSMGRDTLLATNTVLNPSLETDTANWGYGNASVSQDPSWAKAGANSARLTTVAANAQTFARAFGPSASAGRYHPYKPGEYVSARVTVRGLRACGVRLTFLFYDAADVFVTSDAGTIQALPQDGIMEVARPNSRVLNANVVSCSPVLYVFENVGGTLVQTAAVPYIAYDGLIVENSGAVPMGAWPTYFDGDTPDTATDAYAWTGTPHASPSTHTAIDRAALTWDQAACLGPRPSLGRWADVPASYRWNGIAPGITWNTWPY